MIKCVSLSALLSLGLAVAPAVADTFFANKTITMMNAGSPGGGYDLYARTVTRHMQRRIPGEPNIVNTNVPGAGSLTLTNQLYSRSPRDGLTMGMPFPGAILGLNSPEFSRHPRRSFSAAVRIRRATASRF